MIIIRNLLPGKQEQCYQFLANMETQTQVRIKERKEETRDAEHVIYTCRALI